MCHKKLPNESPEPTRLYLNLVRNLRDFICFKYLVKCQTQKPAKHLARAMRDTWWICALALIIVSFMTEIALYELDLRPNRARQEQNMQNSDVFEHVQK